MKSNRKTWLKVVMCLALSMTLFWQGSMSVFAINTEFDVPTIEKEWTPENCKYKSPNLNIMVCQWGYGLVADVLNTSNVDTLLAELHANVSTAGNSRSILAIYMEGAGLSDANAAEIANAGWTEVELYYETFLVAGDAPVGAMKPSVAMILDENAMTVLSNAGITENIAMVSVSDVNMTWANYILYEPEFSFLKGKELHSYKFIGDVGVFVPIEETYFGTYGANFLELYDLQKAEAEIDGIYVTVTESLPESIVVSADQVATLRENVPVTQPSEESPKKPAEKEDASVPAEESKEEQSVESEEPIESEPETENEPTAEQKKEALVVTDSTETVEWKFAGGQVPENFTAEAKVTALSETEVSVDFAYTGLLPEGTEVSVAIPEDEVTYQEGDRLYLYYCNPETNERDFVGEGTYRESRVTFQLSHCSEYVISTIGPESSGKTAIWVIAGVLVVTACGAWRGSLYRGRKRS